MSLDVTLTVRKVVEVVETSRVFDANVTHNMSPMAVAAGIGRHLWEPQEIGITKARQLIEPLSIALSLMKRDPTSFKKLSPQNGWGSYDSFVPWLEKYIAACCEFPDADVSVSV